MWLDAALDVGMDAIVAAYPYLGLHTSGAASVSTNESTASRVAASWTSNTGDASVSSKNFTGGAANGACIRVGYWSLATGGTFGGGSLLTGDQTFNAAGEYTITSIAENTSST